MNSENRRAAFAALAIVLAFGIGAYFMPSLMLALGDYSAVAAGAIAVLFVAAFFGLFWLRGRAQNRRNRQ